VQILVGIFWLINEVLTLYWWAIIIAAVLSNLLAFGVLDQRSRFVSSLGEFFYRITEPALRPIRQVIPAFGGIDISPIILLLLLGFLQRFVLPTIEQAVFGALL
jgi:YggT family protein